MKFGVIFKKSLFLLIILSLVSVVNAAHTINVTLYNQTSLYETQNANFTLKISQIFSEENPHQVYYINLSIPTNYLKIINYKIPSGLTCFNNSYNSNPFVINCKNDFNTYFWNYLLNFTAIIINSDENETIYINTTDSTGLINNYNVTFGILNDINPPVINSNSPQNGSFVKAEIIRLEINVSDKETGISNGTIDYDIMDPYYGDNTLQNHNNLTCDNNKCYIELNLNNPLYRYLVLNYNIYDKVSNNIILKQSMRIDNDIPKIDLNNLISSVNTNFIFNFNVSDDSFYNSYKDIGPYLSPNVTCSLKIDNLDNGNSIIEICDNLPQSDCNPLINVTHIITPDLNSLSDGIHNYNLSCQDKAGYIGSNSNLFTLDRTGPNIILNSPADNSLIANGTIINLTINDSYSEVSLVNYSLDGSSDINLLSPYEIPTNLWSAGIHNILINANDSLGNNASKMFQFIIDNDNPLINLNSPILNVLTNSTIIFNYSITDMFSKNFVCSILLDGSLLTNTNAVNGSNIYSHNGIIDNNHNWSVSCTDEVGHLGRSINGSFVTDTTAPQINSIICDPQDNQNGNGILTCNMDIIDPNFDSCSLYVNGSKVNNTNTNVISYNLIDSSNNIFSRYLICNDTAGNSNTSNKTYFYYDNIAPSIFDVHNETPRTTEITIKWITNELSNTSVYYENVTFNLLQGINSSVYNHSYSLTGLADNTTYDYRVISSDRWGNINSSDVYSFTTAVITVGTGGGSGGGGGGGGGGGSNPSCVTNWTCLNWGNCLEGKQICVGYAQTCNDQPAENNIKTKSCEKTLQQQPIIESNNQEVTPAEEVSNSNSITGYSVYDNLIGKIKMKSSLLLALLAIIIAMAIFALKKRYPTINPKLLEKDLMSIKKPEVKTVKPMINPQINKNKFNEYTDYRKDNMNKKLQ
ncbi:MAG: fibronectin type III domain-containing protein [Candidatus Nanoarchaeia archaeon]|nr:fibronectin type III domain-containing protein [Candidatus Nanoarchaeia archaeon]